MTIIKCDYCGKEFNKGKKNIEKSKHNFCCKECYNKYSVKNSNDYVIKDKYCELHIKNKKTNRYVIVLISLSDVEKVKRGKWCACYDKSIDNYYIRGRIDKKQIQLHRYLTNCPDNLQVDHINRNTTDNRQENLRIVTNKENSHNKSQYGLPNKFNDKGICYHITRKKYCVKLGENYIGTFNTLEEAKEAKRLYLNGEWELKPKRAYKKQVQCVETGKNYVSISEASKDMNINRQQIELCCKGKKEMAGGYHWITIQD